jgi:hypothetical protein
MVTTTAVMEWKIPIEGTDVFGEVRRHEIRVDKSWDRLFDGEICLSVDDGKEDDSVDKRSLRATATAISEAKTGLLASSGEDWRWKGDELRQLPQILGGGCQEALVFRSARSPQAQLTEPEDALQVSKQHLDLLSLPA